MTTVVRGIDFFKIAKAMNVSVDDVIRAWDGKEYIPEDSFEDNMRSWANRIRNKEEAPSNFLKRDA